MPSHIEQFEQVLASWRTSLCPQIELAALIARNPTAHKWKTTYRSIVLRELVFWRLQDLLVQVVALWKQNHTLGAIVLLRSALETLGVLIYLNQKTEDVVNGEEDFFDFARATARLMLGSKNRSTATESINILTVLKRSNKRYPGLMDIYAELSESAHPNYQGVCSGYSRIDEKHYITKFSNRWSNKYAERLSLGIELCIRVFETEYNNVWNNNFESLEVWLIENDARLEAAKSGI